jgi:RNA polymerase sigma factor (sigma-70 family)
VDPPGDPIRAATGRSVEVVVDALKHRVDVVSLSDPVDADSRRTLADTLAADSGAETHEASEDKATLVARAIQTALLTPRERSVIEAYYGLGQFRGLAEQTLEQIGAHYGISRERARQIRDTAMAKIAAQFGVRLDAGTATRLPLTGYASRRNQIVDDPACVNAG